MFILGRRRLEGDYDFVKLLLRLFASGIFRRFRRLVETLFEHDIDFK